MQPHSWVALVTIAALLLYFCMGLNIAGARRKCGIHAPAMTGDPIYFNDPAARALVPLDRALYERIKSGKVRL